MNTLPFSRLFARFLLLLMPFGPCLAAPEVVLTPGSQTVVLGSQFTVDLVVSGLGHGVALSAFDLGIDFDATAMSFASATFGDQLDLFGLGDLQAVTVTPGRVELFEVSLDPSSDLLRLQALSFRLGRITFDTVGLASGSPLLLSMNAFGDADGVELAAALRGAVVTIAAVPENATFLLALVGCCVVGGVMRSRRKRL